MFDASHWQSISDVTLTLKDCGSPNAREYYEDNFATFMAILNGRVFKKAAKRYGKKLRVLAVIEKSLYGRWNIHGAIEPPDHCNHDEFAAHVKAAWLKTRYGNEQMLVRPGADLKWIDYMLKPQQKSALDHYPDCILSTHHNPPC